MEDEGRKGFWNIGFAAAWTGAITILCILIGQTAAQFAGATSGERFVVSGAATTPFNALDREPTGSVKARGITLSPCGPTANGQ